MFVPLAAHLGLYTMLEAFCLNVAGNLLGCASLGCIRHNDLFGLLRGGCSPIG